jgi:hypothetical protein
MNLILFQKGDDPRYVGESEAFAVICALGNVAARLQYAPAIVVALPVIPRDNHHRQEHLLHGLSESVMELAEHTFCRSFHMLESGLTEVSKETKPETSHLISQSLATTRLNDQDD